MSECEKGSDNYKNVELKIFDAHKRHLDELKNANNLSVQDEMLYWFNLANECEEGSVLYKYTWEKYNEALKKYDDEFVKSQEEMGEGK